MTLTDPDDDDDDDLCTSIVAILQKDRRKKRKEGLDMLTIGYVIYKVSLYFVTLQYMYECVLFDKFFSFLFETLLMQIL